MSEYLSLWPWRGPLYGPPPATGKDRPFIEYRGSRTELERFLEKHAIAHGFSLKDYASPSAVHALAHPRQDAMASAYAAQRWSTITIGAALNRDHSTVVHGIRASNVRRSLAQQEAAA